MSKKKKYDSAFITAFDIKIEKLDSDLKYESITEWDSIGHMGLIAELEDAFEISMEMDDIIDFSSYVKGVEILKKYKKGSARGLELVYDEIYERLHKQKKEALVASTIDSLYLSSDVFISPDIK